MAIVENKEIYYVLSYTPKGFERIPSVVVKNKPSQESLDKLFHDTGIFWESHQIQLIDSINDIKDLRKSHKQNKISQLQNEINKLREELDQLNN